MASALTAQSPSLFAIQRPFDDILSLYAVDHDAYVSVQFVGEVVPNVKGREPVFKNPLDKRRLQVWLLRSDGTSLRQTRAPLHAGISMAGHDEDVMQFTFEPVLPAELVGVVAMVDGKILAWEIAATSR
jgi:hypothetical protein